MNAAVGASPRTGTREETGYEIRTEGDFDKALIAARQDTSGPSILHVHPDPQDCRHALARMAERMGRNVVQ